MQLIISDGHSKGSRSYDLIYSKMPLVFISTLHYNQNRFYKGR